MQIFQIKEDKDLSKIYQIKFDMDLVKLYQIKVDPKSKQAILDKIGQGFLLMYFILFLLSCIFKRTSTVFILVVVAPVEATHHCFAGRIEQRAHAIQTTQDFFRRKKAKLIL
jgi:hypothetical protein